MQELGSFGGTCQFLHIMRSDMHCEWCEENGHINLMGSRIHVLYVMAWLCSGELIFRTTAGLNISINFSELLQRP